MISIGIIAEGFTDQLVIDQIVYGYFGNDDCHETRFLQPSRDTTDLAQHDTGGWGNLLNYCKDDKLMEGALTTSDYLIVHIDTDKLSEFSNQATGQEEPLKKLELCEKELSDLIKNEILDEYGHKVIFAIAVDSVECWLLPFHEIDPRRRKKGRTINCLNRLNEILEKQGKGQIVKGNKSYRDIYQELSQHLTKTSKLKGHAQHDVSFNRFYENLESRFSEIDPCAV